MCGSSDVPEAPDPYETADAQKAMNIATAREQAKLNAVDQFGPMGSTTYQRNADGTPTSQTVNLSPEMKSWLDAQFGASTKLQNATSAQLGNLPTDRFQLPSDKSGDDYARQAFGDDILDSSRFTDTGAIADDSYASAKAQFQPDIDAARKSKQVELSDRKIPIGSEIWNDEMDRLDRGANTAYEGAARSARLDAGNEQTRRQNAATQALNYGGNQYQTNLGNELLERSRPYEEAAALMGTTPQFSTPSFMQTSQSNIASPDLMGAVNQNYANQMTQYNANQANKQGVMKTVGGVAGTIAMMSDENTKEHREAANGEAILDAFRGLPVDDYRYKDEARETFELPERRTGPMAQDYAETFGGDGHTIDLGDAVGKLFAAVKALDARTERRAA